MKYLFACGGTGGHIFPAVSVAEEIKKRNPAAQVVYACGQKDIEHEIFKVVIGETVVAVDSAPFEGARSLWNPVFLIKLAKGFWQALCLVRREKPDIVAGFGGHFSFPVLWASLLLGRKTMIHEQNVEPGVANKALSRWVRGVALSFAETQSYLPGVRRVRVTGNPIRASIEKDVREEALRYFRFSPDRRTLLVLGGSQGAESINTLFLQTLSLLPDSLKAKIQVLHLCGRMPVQSVQEKFRQEGVTGRAYSFFEKMDLAYALCRLAIGRAGATFLAEISAKRIPAILIPYPFGRGHQRLNAEIFSRHHSAVVMEQAGATPELLGRKIQDMIEKNDKNQGSDDRTDGTPPARELLADYLEEIAHGR